jgi:hypothetical protein
VGRDRGTPIEYLVTERSAFRPLMSKGRSDDEGDRLVAVPGIVVAGIEIALSVDAAHLRWQRPGAVAIPGLPVRHPATHTTPDADPGKGKGPRS